MKYAKILALLIIPCLLILYCFTLFHPQQHVHAQNPSTNGIPYYQNGVVTYLNPIGGIIANPTWNPPVLRTAINAGLRGTPGQIWIVNSNGDGQAVNLGPGLVLNKTGNSYELDVNLLPNSLGSNFADLSVINPTTLRVCSTCSSSNPFVFRIHNALYSITSYCDVTIDSTISGNVGIFVNKNGFYALGDGFMNSIPPASTNESTTCLTFSTTGVSYPQPRSIPIGSWLINNGVWDTTDFATHASYLTPYYSESETFTPFLTAVDNGDSLDYNLFPPVISQETSVTSTYACFGQQITTILGLFKNGTIVSGSTYSVYTSAMNPSGISTNECINTTMTVGDDFILIGY